MNVQFSPARFIDSGDAESFDSLERHAFLFGHRLAASPLFGMDGLRSLVEYMQTNGLGGHFEYGPNKVAAGWGNRPQGASLIEAFDGLQDGNTLILLNSAHRHPAYGALLETLLGEVGDLANIKMNVRYKVPICTIIIASPKRVTPYHMDNSHNLLFQVHGAKTFYVFDGSDPLIVSDLERERFWSGNQNAAIYSEDKQIRATRCDLKPGDGIHVPTTYPHWAENGEDVSVAVSINFQSVHDADAAIYRVNGLLRRTGLHPSGPGRNRTVDASKVLAYRTMTSVRNAMRRNHRSSGTA